jgi:hypothetical protein
MPNTTLNAFGGLRKTLKNRLDFPISFDLNGPTSLTRLLERFEIPMDKVQLIMVNHRAVPKGTTIQPGDRLALFPREYPFFADWKDYRWNDSSSND